MLEALDRGNLFLVPLDDRRQWYRYHQLFADVLRAHLLDEQPEQVPELHRRASEWYEQNGERSEAIRHALAGGDLERAADLVELAIPATEPGPTGGHAARLARGAARRAAPGAAGAEQRLCRVAPRQGRGRGRRGAPAGRRAVARRRRTRPRSTRSRLDGRGRRGGVPPPAGLDRRAPGRPGPDPRRRGRHHGPCPAGARPRRRGRPPRAGVAGPRSWPSPTGRPGISRPRVAGTPPAWRAWRRPGTSRTSSGARSPWPTSGSRRVACARRCASYERGLALATGQGGPVLRGAADMHVGISALLRERDDLEGARSTCCEAEELGEENGLPQNRYRSRVAMAAIRQAEGDLDGALELLAEAERLYVERLLPGCAPGRGPEGTRVDRPGEAVGGLGLGARARPVGGRRARATSTSSSTSRSPGCSWPEGDATVPTRHDRAATELLARLLAAAEDGERNGSVIEILVLQALAHQARGDVAGALTRWSARSRWPSRRATSASSSTKGQPMAALLKLAAKQRDRLGAMSRRLLAAAVTAEGPSAGRAAADRAAQRTGARGPAPPRERPRRPGHRPRAHGVADHRADAHQEHLRQARREQPAGSRPPCRRARPALALAGPPAHSVGLRPPGLAPRSHVEARESAVAVVSTNHHPAHHVW